LNRNDDEALKIFEELSEHYLSDTGKFAGTFRTEMDIGGRDQVKEVVRASFMEVLHMLRPPDEHEIGLMDPVDRKKTTRFRAAGH
jgi:hypothetical protein